MGKKIILYLAFIAFIPLGLAAGFRLQPFQSKITAMSCCHTFGIYHILLQFVGGAIIIASMVFLIKRLIRK